MSHPDFGYNWRATMDNADAVPVDVADYLDVVASLVQGDSYYPDRTASLHTCAIDDPIVMLHHVRRIELCSTPADHRLFDKALASVRQHRRRTPCMGCQEMEAFERIEQALFKLIGTTGLEKFAKPGCGSPVSEYTCKWNTKEACSAHGAACDHVYMRVKRVMEKAHDGRGGTELRLNGAGLKLYMQPVRSPVMDGTGIAFGSMRVGGDQVDTYPGFQTFAHQLFTEMGVPTMDGGRRPSPTA